MKQSKIAEKTAELKEKVNALLDYKAKEIEEAEAGIRAAQEAISAAERDMEAAVITGDADAYAAAASRRTSACAHLEYAKKRLAIIRDQHAVMSGTEYAEMQKDALAAAVESYNAICRPEYERLQAVTTMIDTYSSELAELGKVVNTAYCDLVSDIDRKGKPATVGCSHLPNMYAIGNIVNRVMMTYLAEYIQTL